MKNKPNFSGVACAGFDRRRDMRRRRGNVNRIVKTRQFRIFFLLATSCLTKITTVEVNPKEDTTHLKVSLSVLITCSQLTTVQEVPHQVKEAITPNNRSNRTREGMVVNLSMLREVINLNPRPIPSMCE